MSWEWFIYKKIDDDSNAWGLKSRAKDQLEVQETFLVGSGSLPGFDVPAQAIYRNLGIVYTCACDFDVPLDRSDFAIVGQKLKNVPLYLRSDWFVLYSHHEYSKYGGSKNFESAPFRELPNIKNERK